MKNKFALITGGSQGLGASISMNLAARGYNIIITARSKDRMERFSKQLSEKYGVEVLCFPLDLSEGSAGSKLVKWITDLFDGIVFK